MESGVFHRGIVKQTRKIGYLGWVRAGAAPSAWIPTSTDGNPTRRGDKKFRATKDAKLAQLNFACFCRYMVNFLLKISDLGEMDAVDTEGRVQEPRSPNNHLATHQKSP